jgi:hypothetical protein
MSLRRLCPLDKPTTRAQLDFGQFWPLQSTPFLGFSNTPVIFLAVAAASVPREKSRVAHISRQFQKFDHLKLAKVQLRRCQYIRTELSARAQAD